MSRQSIVFCMELVMVIQILILIMLFSLSRTQNYFSCCKFIKKNNQNLSKLLSKDFKRSLYWNEYKTKSESKNMSNEYRHLFKSNFLGGNRLFVLVYSSQNGNSKRFKTRRYYLPKVIIKNYTSLSIKKTFMTNPLIQI